MAGERSRRDLLDETRTHLEVAARGLGELKTLLDQVVQAQQTDPDEHAARDEQ